MASPMMAPVTLPSAAVPRIKREPLSPPRTPVPSPSLDFVPLPEIKTTVASPVVTADETVVEDSFASSVLEIEKKDEVAQEERDDDRDYVEKYEDFLESLETGDETKRSSIVEVNNLIFVKIF